MSRKQGLPKYMWSSSTSAEESVPSPTVLSFSESSNESPFGLMAYNSEDVLPFDEQIDLAAAKNGDPAKTEMIFHCNSDSAKHMDIMDLVSCSCCRQEDLDEREIIDLVQKQPLARRQSLFSESFESDDDEHDEDKIAESGIIDGLYFTTTKVLVEGLLHKKGTGNDWLGSRGWKVRWAKLALARVDGESVPVPMLLVSWYSTGLASTSILLKNTVVLANDQKNSFRFEIRDTKTQLSRTFTAPSRKARDAWVYSISQALLSYEKEKAAHLQPLTRSFSSPIPRMSDDCWNTERTINRRPVSPTQFLNSTVRPLSSRPSSPPVSPMQRPYAPARPPSSPRPPSREGMASPPRPRRPMSPPLTPSAKRLPLKMVPGSAEI